MPSLKTKRLIPLSNSNIKKRNQSKRKLKHLVKMLAIKELNQDKREKLILQALAMVTKLKDIKEEDLEAEEAIKVVITKIDKIITKRKEEVTIEVVTEAQEEEEAVEEVDTKEKVNNNTDLKLLDTKEKVELLKKLKEKLEKM